MTREIIRERRDTLRAKIREHQRGIEHVLVDIQHLQIDCSHPAQRSRSVMGKETILECLDCGWQS